MGRGSMRHVEPSCRADRRAPPAAQREPSNVHVLASLALFQWEERGDKHSADVLFAAAATLAPSDLDILASRAYFTMVAGA